MTGIFFHKGISCFQAEVFLMNKKEDGSFLVRDSESLQGAYVLCLLHQNKVHHYRILPGQDGNLHVQSETGIVQFGYNDLAELIAEYIKRKEQNGLVGALIHPVAPEGLCEDVDSSDDDKEEEVDFESPPPSVQPPPTPDEKKLNGPPEEGKIDLVKNFAMLDLSKCDEEFCTELKNYSQQGYQKDSESVNVGDSELSEFTKLIEVAAQGIKKELNNFQMKLEILKEFLEVGGKRYTTLECRHEMSGSGLLNLLEQLLQTRNEVLTLQTKAQEKIQTASIPSNNEYISVPLCSKNGIKSVRSLQSSTYKTYKPQSQFEVKKVNHTKASKITLTVDLHVGKYTVMKQMGKKSSGQSTITHDRILHLIKSTKDNCWLDIILDGKKKQSYIFNDPHTRENFCLQIRQMKNMHSVVMEIDQISVFVGTWNMGDAALNQSLSTWLKCTGAGNSRDRVLGVIPHDLYVIGTQESTMTEKDWINTLKAGLKACVLVDMELVEVCTLWGIRLAILVNPEYKHCISRIQRSSVRTGIANALGNKGAVAISFYFNGTSFCFINAHLTSGDERKNKRNQNFRDIIKALTISLGQKHWSLFDVTMQFHHVFWFGDLNYRIEEQIMYLLRKVQENDIQYLLSKDQLKQLQKQKRVFSGFVEPEITFLPTYRLERNTPGYRYAWKKVKKTGERINSPSWCDRVLWKSYPGTFVENVAYGCSEAILSSDHRPVFSSFNIGISSEFVQTRASLLELAPVQFIFHFVEAQVKTCCKQYFQLVFHSTCLKEVYKSLPNSSFQENRTGFYTIPVWTSEHIPKMMPIFGDIDFLEEQHILIAVVAKDGDNDSYGECVLSLRNMFSSNFMDFEYPLLHQGEESGILKGKVHMTSSQVKRHSISSKKSYSLITFDTDYHDPEISVTVTPKDHMAVSARAGADVGAFQQTTSLADDKPPPLNSQSSYLNIQGKKKISNSTLTARAPAPLLVIEQSTPSPRKSQTSVTSATLRTHRQTSNPPQT